MLGKFIISFFLISSLAAADFQSVLKDLDQHHLVQAKLQDAESLNSLSEKEGSWGDPTLDVAAVNFPRETLNQDVSMMTGFRVGLSQSINLSGKYGKERESMEKMASSQKANALQLKRTLAKTLWELAAEKSKLIQTREILKENLTWTRDNLKVSKRLYSTGKVPQQAVLDIQMRKSELEASLANVVAMIKVVDQEVTSLIGKEGELKLNVESVPWTHLDKWKKAAENYDFRKKELEDQLKASDLKVSAKRRNLLPDIKVGFNYTKRNDVDGLGDFVGASITIPLPTSSKRYADKSSALAQKLAAQKRYRYYQKTKPVLLKKMALEIEDEENQLSILKKQTLKYAKSSRDVTARSYARGGADYLELLRSELQYQDQRMKKVNLEAALKKKKVSYLFLQGDDLGLGSMK